MNYGELLYEVPNDLRRLYRALERQKKKMTSLTWSCTFNIYRYVKKNERVPGSLYILIEVIILKESLFINDNKRQSL